MYEIHDIESCSSIDAATSRSIRDGIGERLKDTLKQQPVLPPQLSDLLESLKRQDQSPSLRAGR